MEDVIMSKRFKAIHGVVDEEAHFLRIRRGVRNEKSAFTLAEVLITLGVIGVIAAMTIPTLSANYRKQEVVSKLKKVYSMVNQAIKLSEVEYGEQANWDMDCGVSGSIKCTKEEAIEKFNKYIGKHLEIIKTDIGQNGTFLVYLKDGSILSVRYWLYDYGFYINKNAIINEKPGINYFRFRFNAKLPAGQDLGKNRDFGKGTFEPYYRNWNGTREQLVSGDLYSCDGNEPAYCAKLIQYDGWQIKDDYPLRF